MSVFQTTFSSAITIYPADALIPSRNLVYVGTNDNGGGVIVDDPNASFITWGVKPGDVVYDTDSGTGAAVVKVVSENRLDVSSANMSNGGSYRLYRQSDYSGIQSYGAYLYNGDTFPRYMEVEVIGGESLVVNIQAMSVFPIQLKRLKNTDIPPGYALALW